MWQRLLTSVTLTGLLFSAVACADNGGSTDADEAGAEGSATSGVTESGADLYESVQIGNRDAMSIPILGGPDWLAIDQEHLYVKRDDGGVTVLDPATGEVVSAFDIQGERSSGLGVAAGRLWVCAGGNLSRFDPSTGDIQASIPVSKAVEQGHLVVVSDRIWLLLGDGTSLLGIDTDSNIPGEPIVLPIRGTDLAVGSDRIWVYSGVDNAAVEIDPVTGSVGRRIDGLAGARAAVAVPGGLWVGGSTASYRIDVATAAITATVPGGIGYDGGIAADDSSVWVRNGFLTLQRLDAVTGAVLEEISEDIGTAGGDIIVAFDALWVSFYDDATLLRIPLSSRAEPGA